MKRFQLLLCGMLVMILIQGCAPKRVSKPASRQYSTEFIPQTKYGNNNQRTKQLAKFVTTNLITSKGIYSQNNGNRTLLSETAGLWLIYLAQSGQKTKFRQAYRQTVTTFENDGLLMYRMRVSTGKRSKVNATLDDLRVIRSLGLYAAKTHDEYYQTKAIQRFAALKRKVSKNGQLRDFYDTEYQQISPLTSLAYYDLLTLREYEMKSTYAKQLRLVQRGYLGAQLPLYAVNYDWTKQRYSTSELNTSEALLTLLHLAEVGHLKDASLRWLANQVTNSTLYNRYKVTGEVSDWNESAANYSIAARIFAVARHPRLYQLAMSQVWRFQIQDSHSNLQGGLGDSNQNVSYAFNDLQALVSAGY
ncbi:glycosyl hydrolase family 8 [Lactobacillus sp. LC28-10]|uniref:Glycosyl hydrolase family 8 n=1 Tax=Secundilactobacillus angelensis TaxID=2722706 RepID=A0ABX1L1X5_9LACO|nr:glycosyl hydrolase family 8 [Secundilactobacillus angelensis]MCH5462773.1 glycosyl hydrolase family 8 [Secundilactobacillus angelensis]NLR19073.1 glycosyl hydrolase family 8 [Secundilactobacillus angelensis]